MHRQYHVGRQGFDKGAFEKGDHAPRKMAKRFRIYQLAFSIFALLGFRVIQAGEAAPDTSWRVWLEPTMMRAPVTKAIGGAKRTEIASGGLTADGLVGYSKAAFDALGVPWEEFDAKARLNAAADLAELTPRYERDSKKVIVYAALESEKPIVSSAVLAPKFLDLFKDTLGEKVFVVVPNRFTAFVFPQLASQYREFAPMIFRAYRETAWPVSVEVFEVSQAGWRCVGLYEEP
jgi:hypothetical protein